MRDICWWTEIDMWEENDCVEVSSHWQTTCGNHLALGMTIIHKFEHCPYCGKSISTIPQSKIPQSLECIKNYLDNNIRHWRKVSKDNSSRSMAFHYIDAYQSVRISIIGKCLPEEE